MIMGKPTKINLLQRTPKPNQFPLSLKEHQAHRVYRVMLPLRNGPNKRVVFSNTTICSGKKLICRFSKKAWPFAKQQFENWQFCLILALWLRGVLSHFMVVNSIYYDYSRLLRSVSISNEQRNQISKIYDSQKRPNLALKLSPRE